MVMNSSDPRLNEENTDGKGGSRRNISSDMINISQIRIPTIMVTFQEAPVIRTSIINV